MPKPTLSMTWFGRFTTTVFNYDYVGALPNGPARQANLYALALRADQFEKSNFKGLSRFISMIDNILESQHDLASVAVAPPKDAVELMTIHKSKGLEFPYVFILNMDQDFNKQDTMSEVILSRKNGLGVKVYCQDRYRSSGSPLP